MNARTNDPSHDAGGGYDGLLRFLRVLGAFLLRIGKRKLEPDDAAVRLQAVLEGRAPNAPRTARHDVVRGVQGRIDPGKANLAQREEAAGNFRGAIAIDARDPRLHLKRGDLLLRIRDNEGAAQSFLVAANLYEEGGFSLKATAVLKQVLHINPNRPDIHERLARIYEALGLSSDAERCREQIRALAEQRAPIAGRDDSVLPERTEALLALVDDIDERDALLAYFHDRIVRSEQPRTLASFILAYLDDPRGHEG